MAAPIRVQATPKATADNQLSVSMTFSTPPTVGGGLIVAIARSSGTLVTGTGCTDNKGNTFTLVFSYASPIGTGSIALFYCPAITVTGASFTITVTASNTSDWTGVAIETNTGLALHISQNGNGISTTASTVTTTVTEPDLFAIGVMTVDVAEASIAVSSGSGITWIQEIEELTITTAITCEVDYASLTGWAATIAATWTFPSSSWWACGVASFKIASTTAARISQLPLETAILSDAPIALRLSQLPIEIAIDVTIIPPSVTETIQFIVVMP